MMNQEKLDKLVKRNNLSFFLYFVLNELKKGNLSVCEIEFDEIKDWPYYSGDVLSYNKIYYIYKTGKIIKNFSFNFPFIVINKIESFSFDSDTFEVTKYFNEEIDKAYNNLFPIFKNKVLFDIDIPELTINFNSQKYFGKIDPFILKNILESIYGVGSTGAAPVKSLSPELLYKYLNNLNIYFKKDISLNKLKYFDIDKNDILNSRIERYGIEIPKTSNEIKNITNINSSDLFETSLIENIGIEKFLDTGDLNFLKIKKDFQNKKLKSSVRFRKNYLSLN